MDWSMEAKESKRGGIMTRNGGGQACRFPSGNEQFHTRSCARCSGLLVRDWCYDLNNAGDYNAEILRCVQCGHCIDPVILRNHIRPRGKSQRVRRVRHACSVRIVVSSGIR